MVANPEEENALKRLHCAFQYLKGTSKKEGEGFVQVDGDRTSDNGFKQKRSDLV